MASRLSVSGSDTDKLNVCPDNAVDGLHDIEMDYFQPQQINWLPDNDDSECLRKSVNVSRHEI